ncbi:hypothetical protein P4597_26635 [Peribacillus simplex]|uniref:hypothetical protein n=1 Tax=Peribacillus simplex TaxID=1478 RepID=UPI002E1D9A1F|nr:hypothetical protein [Peribacillus simplex]
MTTRIGSGYLGSPTILKSTSNQQCLPNPPASWSKGYNLYKFSFSNPNQPCTVKVNEGDPIYIAAGSGFNTDYYDSPIWSFVVIEPNIDFYWVGAY